MSGRLAIDFGTSNTVVSVWDEAYQVGRPFEIADYGILDLNAGEAVSIIPSVINYDLSGRQWIGNQVIQRNLLTEKETFRDMKRYISIRYSTPKNVGIRRITNFEAGRDFLSAVLASAKTELDIENEEIAFTVPVDAYEHYTDWLTGVAEAAGLPRFRLIDEPSAAALGYSANIQPNDVYLVFDFGGGTLDIAVVIIEAEDKATGGRRCRVLGKAGLDLGGSRIDEWIFEQALESNGLKSTDELVQRVSRNLLNECESAKKILSSKDVADIGVFDPDTGAAVSMQFSRFQFEEMLEKKRVFMKINDVISKALNVAREQGYDEHHIKAILMVGGTSIIPCIQRAIKNRFGDERVKLSRPMDAVARGAAAFVAGVDFYDHIQHDYAIRHISSKTGDYDYIQIVKRGTPFPTNEPVARKTLKATFEGQTYLGISIFELGDRRRNDQVDIELIFDPTGAARLVNVDAAEIERRTQFWMNEHNPTFLRSDPPAGRGEARFQVEFNIDGNKRLLVTARDLKTGKLTHKDHPVIKLT